MQQLYTTIFAGRAAGMDGYLTKPLSPSALTQVLGSLPPRPPT